MVRFLWRVLRGLNWVIFLVAAMPPYAVGESFRISPYVASIFGMETGYVWLSGEALIPAGGRPGSGALIDVSGDLAADEAESTSIVLESCVLQRHLLNVELISFAPTGRRLLPRTVRFHNRTYAEGTTIQTKLDFNWLRAGYGFKLFDYTAWWLAPRVGAHHIRHGITINGETKEEGLISNARRLDATYPTIGLEWRYLFPYGAEACLELEGTHLITRGWLAFGRVGAHWELRPDVVLTFGWTVRAVHSIEDNQQLNNEWFYVIGGVSAGLAFTF